MYVTLKVTVKNNQSLNMARYFINMIFILSLTWHALSKSIIRCVTEEALLARYGLVRCHAQFF